MTDKRQATIGHEYPCFAGDGEAARMMRATDWAATPLGPVEGWPPGLGSIVATSKATANARAAGFAHYLVKPVDPAPAGADGRLWRRRRAGAAAIAGRQCDGAVELRVKWAAGACAASTSSYEKNTNDARPPQQKSGGRGAGQAGTPRNGLGPAAGVVPWGKTPQAAQGGQSFSSRRSAARSTGLRK